MALRRVRSRELPVEPTTDNSRKEEATLLDLRRVRSRELPVETTTDNSRKEEATLLDLRRVLTEDGGRDKEQQALDWT